MISSRSRRNSALSTFSLTSRRTSSLTAGIAAFKLPHITTRASSSALAKATSSQPTRTRRHRCFARDCEKSELAIPTNSRSIGTTTALSGCNLWLWRDLRPRLAGIQQRHDCRHDSRCIFQLMKFFRGKVCTCRIRRNPLTRDLYHAQNFAVAVNDRSSHELLNDLCVLAVLFSFLLQADELK